MSILVKKAQRGDAEAFIALMEENKMTLRRVAYGYLQNEEDVADAIQDTILDAFENMEVPSKKPSGGQPGNFPAVFWRAVYYQGNFRDSPYQGKYRKKPHPSGQGTASHRDADRLGGGYYEPGYF